MLISPKTVATVPANPIWMIAQAVTILRDARIRNAAPTASFTCRKITLPARIHATMTDSKRRRHIPHIAFQRRSAGGGEEDPWRASKWSAPRFLRRPDLLARVAKSRCITERCDDRSRVTLRSGEKPGRGARRTVFTTDFAATASGHPALVHAKWVSLGEPEPAVGTRRDANYLPDTAYGEALPKSCPQVTIFWKSTCSAAISAQGNERETEVSDRCRRDLGTVRRTWHHRSDRTGLPGSHRRIWIC